MTPVFLHINSSGGRYLRKKFCEKYDNVFYVHHINPLLFVADGIDKDKIIRFWRFRDVTKINKGETTLKISNTISVLDLDVKDKAYFTTLRNPVDRYLSELSRGGGIDLSDNILSHNIMVKSLLVALTGDVSHYLRETDEESYNKVIEGLKGMTIMIMDEGDESYKTLNEKYEFNTPVDFSKYKRKEIEEIMAERIREINQWDIKLYNHYKE